MPIKSIRQSSSKKKEQKFFISPRVKELSGILKGPLDRQRLLRERFEKVLWHHFEKKTIELDVGTVKKLRHLFHVKTDKEAVNKALRLVADEEKIIRTHKALAGSARLKAPFS